MDTLELDFSGAPDPTQPDAWRSARDLLPSAPAPEASLRPGTIWDGRYRVESTIGEGGMGSVVLAADLARDNQPVALKVLRPRFRDVATPGFLREYAVQRVLRHPAIPRALDLGFDLRDGKEVPYFTMPFLAGESLSSMLERELPPLQSVWRWMIEVLEALDAMHRAGYLHRDLKPGNILVDRDAEDGPQARLIDFGITTAFTTEPEALFTGTPGYCAPEVIEGAPHDARSDLYAVGLVLFELIEGDVPWDAVDIDELHELRRHQTAPTIARRDCPPGIRALVAELLASDIGSRPASAAEVIARMRATLGMSPVLGSAAAFAQRLAGVRVPSPSYVRALQVEGEVVLIETPSGHDVGALLGEIGDQWALRGVRVVRVRIEGAAGPALHELEGALDVLRRLRADDGMSQLYRGLAGAATLLTRMHRRTVLVIDGLERADEATLSVLRHAFLGARNAALTVIASVAKDVRARCPKALAAFAEESFVSHVTLADLTVAETLAYVRAVLGEGVPDRATIEGLHRAAQGRPAILRQMLETAFDSGVLTRTTTGYRWQALVQTDALTTLTRLARERLPLLHTPFPIEAMARYLGGEENLHKLVATGQLNVTDTAAIATEATSWRECFLALPEARRHALHRLMSQALAALPEHLDPILQAAEQLALAGRPAAAAPLFARVGRDAYRSGDDDKGAAQIARARSLVRADRTEGAQLDGWTVEVLGAALDEARTLDDAQRIHVAADELLTAAVAARHIDGIEQALTVQIDEAELQWDAVRAADAIDGLARWQKHHGADGIPGARAWLEAFEQALDGNDVGALRRIAGGLGELEATTSPWKAWSRRKLLALRAEVAVRGGDARIVTSALDAYAADIAEQDLAPLRPSLAPARRLAVWRATWLRRSGDLTRARAALGPDEVVLTGRFAALALAVAECDLALGRCDTAEAHAREALAAASSERNDVVQFLAAAVLAHANARHGDPGQQAERLARLVAHAPLQIPPPLLIEVKLRWLATRLSIDERQDGTAPASARQDELIDDALTVTREALRCKDAGAVARAAFIAARAELRARRPADALRHAEWVSAIDRQQAVGGPPRHAIEWLMASAHFQLKWFRSARQLSGRALESLRAIAHTAVGHDDRERWLRAGDNVLIGLQT